MTQPPLPSQTDRTTAMLRAARRVLVTGRGGIAAQTAARACDLAEAVGAAVDFGGHETAQVAGPTIARIGEVTADPAELRDRADLVVFWCCDPAADAAGFLDRHVTPATAAGHPRHTITVGPRGVSSAAAADRHLPLAAADSVDLARLLAAAAAGKAVPAPAGPLAAARDALRAAIDAAACVAVVTHHRDPVGLDAWSVVGLVRAVSRHKPAFEVPLVAGGSAAAACTWRYGAAGAIVRADRGGAEFRPAECDAARLVARGEVDCVVAIGPLPEAVEAAVAARGDAVAVIRVTGDDATVRSRLDALCAAVRAAMAPGGVA